MWQWLFFGAVAWVIGRDLLTPAPKLPPKDVPPVPPPPPKLPQGKYDFSTRNKAALDAVVARVMLDMTLDANPIGPLKVLIDRLDYYALEQAAPLRAKYVALQAAGKVGVDRTVKFQGW